jgi:hypothetical protein
MYVTGDPVNFWDPWGWDAMGFLRTAEARLRRAVDRAYEEVAAPLLDAVDDFGRGAALGDLYEPRGVAGVAGQILGGLNSAADVRDIGAGVNAVAENKPGGGAQLGGAIVGSVPGVGDAAKALLKGGRAARRVASEGAEAVVESTAKASDNVPTPPHNGPPGSSPPGTTPPGGTGATPPGGTGAPPPGGDAPEHHLMTKKNYVSTARGGPWSPRFEEMARRAGMTLDDAENRVRIPGHEGPHPEDYHRQVFDRLLRATEGLSGDAYSAALRAELERIRAEAATPGSPLNRLIVR